jgi:hypothetical protein
MTTTDCYLSTNELAARWRMSPHTLRNWRSMKYGPVAKKFPPARVLYPMSAILDWEGKKVQP